MKRPIRILLKIAGALVLVTALFVAVIWSREWRPAPIEIVYPTPSSSGPEQADTMAVGDTLKIVSWNIGYAGLGDDMDFFYDGGTRTRTSQTRTRENLNGIISFLKQHSDADFILLQEVDFDSRRSYGIDEYDTIRQELPTFYGWWGLNYVSDFVPIPVTNPMGGVRSGIVILSRWKPEQVTRFAYPGGFPFPVRLFNLKRCLLSASFPVSFPASDSVGSSSVVRTLYINNTHNTAYDTGTMRSGELAFLNGFLAGKRFAVTMGDWNCNPPGYTPSEAALKDKYFSPLGIHREDFPPEMGFVYDPTTPSVRYGYEPYQAATTTTTVLDFALYGAGIEPVEFETIDLEFRNSDHNPVVGRFVIR